MNAADFILIQVDKKDKFYELARVRPYFNDWFCEGFGQTIFTVFIDNKSNKTQIHKLRLPGA